MDFSGSHLKWANNALKLTTWMIATHKRKGQYGLRLFTKKKKVKSSGCIWENILEGTPSQT